MYGQAFRDARSIWSTWPLNALSTQAEEQKIFDQARESIRPYQQILSLQHQTNIEQKIQTFHTLRQALDAILREFADRQEAVMNQKDDRGRPLEQSGTATVRDYTDFFLELFQAVYPLVAGGFKLQRYHIQIEELFKSYPVEQDPTQLPDIEKVFSRQLKLTNSRIKRLQPRTRTDTDAEDVQKLLEGLMALHAPNRYKRSFKSPLRLRTGT